MPAAQTIQPATAAPGLLPSPGGPLLRESSPGLELTGVETGGVREWHLTLRPLPGERPAEAVRRLSQALRREPSVIVRQEIFGPLPLHGEFLKELTHAFGAVTWPVNYVEGAGCTGAPWSGMNVLAVAGASWETIEHGGRVVGGSYQDKWARYVVLGDVRPTDTALPRTDQTRQVYDTMAAILREAGLKMSNVARTWIFLDDILSWYGPFNEVRTRFYREHGVFDGLVPASTGVGGRNPAGAALVAGVWAAEALDGAFAVQEVASPKQCPAPCYGSAFSRAVALVSPSLRRVMVSGTASIEPGGASVCGGDAEAQIDLTLEVVRAILVSRQMDFADVSRGVAYFKRAQDVQSFLAWQAQHGLEAWPVIRAQDDICRDELLFEIEVDALRVPGSNR
jgi:enamine deaminase RidA (YjgF/YER057c/UK114 family)